MRLYIEKTPVVKRSRLNGPVFLPEQCNCRVEPDTIHPGAEFGIALERIIGFPELQYDFLEKVFARFRCITVNPAYFVDDPLIGFNQLRKFNFLGLQRVINWYTKIGELLQIITINYINEETLALIERGYSP